MLEAKHPDRSPPHSEIGTGLTPTAAAMKETGIAAEAEQWFWQVGEAKSGGHRINPEVVVLRTANIGAVAQTTNEHTPAQHHRGVVDRVGSRKGAEDRGMAERHPFALENATRLIHFQAGRTEHVDRGMLLQPIALLLHPGRQRLIVGIHSGNKMPMWIDQHLLQQSIQPLG
jgi:hypothetical protein